MRAPWTDPNVQDAIYSKKSTKEDILYLLRKVQRDNLAEIVACKTSDRSICDAAKEFEVRVEAMNENDNFLPILKEMKHLMGY